MFCHPETGKPLDRSKLVRRFKQAIDRADVHRITFHELRHTFGTRMAAAGTPMRTLQHWMGHADSKTTQIYAHYQPSDQEADAVDRAFAMIERSILGEATTPRCDPRCHLRRHVERPHPRFRVGHAEMAPHLDAVLAAIAIPGHREPDGRPTASASTSER